MQSKIVRAKERIEAEIKGGLGGSGAAAEGAAGEAGAAPEAAKKD